MIHQRHDGRDELSMRRVDGLEIVQRPKAIQRWQVSRGFMVLISFLHAAKASNDGSRELLATNYLREKENSNFCEAKDGGRGSACGVESSVAL